MAKKRRMIDPDIWEDVSFGKLTDKAKLLFIACISNADDEGRLLGHPSHLRALAFRYEDVSLAKVDNLVDEIAGTVKNFKVYHNNPSRYIQLEKWETYQFIRKDRFQPSRIPPCESGGNHAVSGWQPSDNQTVTEERHRVDKIRLDKISTSMSLWNGSMPWKVRAITGRRKDHLLARLREPDFDLAKIMEKIQASDFLMGKANGKNHTNFRADLDWIIVNDTNYIKILEGRYDGKKKTGIERFIKE